MTESITQQDKDELFQIQVNHLNELKEKGIEPYGQKFEASNSASDCHDQYEEGKAVKLAGRITLCRNMGKTKFWDLTDTTGKVQLFLNPKVTDESCYSLLKLLGIGDFLGVEGELFTTKSGEISIRVKSFTVLSKALRPLPAKHHGLKDVESRFRQRYLDLISNPHVKDIFLKRSKIIQSLRNTLASLGFLEVETPMLQSLSGGATAKPFMTHHNALDLALNLRIAPELFLKRLLVGGFDKVYEMNRSFRNEGLSRRHNPEFTMLEVYAAYDDMEGMLNLAEKLIREAGVAVGLEDKWLLPSGKEISFKDPFQRMTMKESIQKWTDFSVDTDEEIRQAGEKEGIENWEKLDPGEILNELFERHVEENLIEPTFITEYPTVLCPLAKRDPNNPAYTQRFELFIDGQELGNAYSELNDPIEQKKRFIEQLEKSTEDGKKKDIDHDFVLALEHGMPPAGGLGIGIDRLVMMLTGANSIREVILFPLLRPEETTTS